MAVTNNFSSSSLDLNGVVNLKQPTALVWGPDGRLYVTEVDGDVKVLTVEFGDKTPGDGDNTAQFFVTGAVSVSAVKDVPNHADATGLPVDLDNRQVTGIDVTPQHDADGVPMLLADGTPMVTMYVTSSDSRIGAGGDGDDAGLDTNSGVLTKLTQTGPDSWTAIDLVRGLARSEENHALNGLEVIQTLDDAGNLVSERLIVANGGNANSGAPSNNFAGQQEQPLSGAILEIDLDMLKAMEVQIDAGTGRAYVYDAPTLDDPTRPGDDATDPWGGNDGLNSAKFVDGGPVKMYSPGYRNSYDVEVTEDGRVFTYDNGANDDWGGRPIGEAGDNGKTNDFDQAPGYISTNLNNGEGNGNDDINLVAWKPFNKDQLHEVTRSDDLAGRFLSAGQGGATLYSDPVTGHTYVYGGHPNPTRAEGSRAGLLFSPKDGAQDAFLLVSNQDSYGNGGGSDYDEVVAWLAEVEADDAKYPTEGIYGADPGELTSRVLAVTPGVEYDIYSFSDGTGAAVPAGGAVPSRAIGGTTEDGVLLGQSGLPSDIAEIVARVNPIEGDYLEAGKTDGAVDTGNGSINGMTEYTSTVFDDGTTKMSGALIAASLNQGSLVVIGRAENGSVPTTVKGGFTIAADRTVIDASGAPLGLASLGDDYEERGLTKAFQGSIWTTVYKQNGPFIEVLQPQAGGVPLAGTELTDPTDADGDGVNYIQDPFEFSQENGYDLGVGQALVLDFSPLNDDFPSSFSSTGLLGAALDGSTPNQDAQTEAENYPVDQQRDGLFDSGANLIPGGNAPLFQIKEVVDGTMVGAGNGVRDAMQTGFKPEADVQRVVSTVSLKNWLPGVVPQVGQLAGMFFGDGTQANFLRAVFGGIEGVGIGLEVGYELNDADYTVLARIPLPTLGLLEGAPETVELRLEIAGLLDGLFDVLVGYKLGEDAGFTNVPLLGGAGFSLPSGVLQDVLTGEHTIPSGAGPQVSGAAVGFVAEDVPGGDLASIDVQEITIEGFGNDILADTGSEVGKSGTSGVDTVIYTGSDTNLAPLASNVENFDGRGSSADYAVAGNALDNVFQMGVGANTVTTGKGSDTVRGTLDQLAGDEITDFGKNDEVIVEGVSAEDATVTYADGSAIVTVNGQSITFSGPEFASFQAAEGPTTFALEDVADGLRITLVPDEAVVYRVNAGSSVGGAGQGTIAAIDGGPDWIGDAGLINSAGPVSLTGATNNAYKDASSDEESEIGYTAGVDEGVVPWQVFVSERSDNNAGGAKITYNFEVEVGATYRIDLFYAEGWSGIFTSSEERQFDVSVEGSMPSAFQDLSPLEEAAAALGIAVPGAGSSQADKDAVLGTALVRSHTMTAGDETLTLQFLHETQNPKVNAIQITQLGGLPVDSTPPEIVSIEVENPQSVQDDPRKATVVLSDERGFDEAAFDGLDGSELTFTGIVPDGVSTPVVSLSDEGKTATLTYTLTPPSAGWPKGEGQLSIAAGAYADAAGNATAAASGTFILEPNLGSLQPGALALAINVGPTSNTTDAALEGSDKQTYGGAIALDPILGIALEADDPSYYAPSSKTGSNIDGKAGPTGSNPALDGSALHTYRDSADGSFTATYPIANGVYVVELWFAELFHDQAGNRQGDYAINGELVELDFDAFTAAGGADTPVKISQAVTVTNGEIVVEVNADTGQPGFNAIVVYEAIEAGGAPVVSVGDVSAVEGGEALVAFTRIGDTTEPVEVTFSLTPGGADATDYSTPLSTTVTIPAGQSTAVVPVSIVDDALEEGAETFTVTIDSVSGGGATIGDATGTVTIAASDVSSDTPAGSAVFALDFETAGDPLAQGGFDGLLGGAGALQAAKASVSGGKLQVATSDGDLSQTSATASKNDFVKAADISAASIQTAFLQTRFDNPFDQAFLADRGLGETVPNYLQQGIVIATGDSGSNQNANQFLKLIWGGVQGTGIQLWSQGTVDAKILLAAISDAAAAAGGTAFQTSDVASVDLTVGIDKAAGTASVYATLFDASGAVLGGVRPGDVPGFATMAPQAIPPAVLTAIQNGTSVFGVTSTDYDQPAGDAQASFPASWDSLTLSSPQLADGPAPAGDAFDGANLGDLSDDNAAPTDLGTLKLGDSVLSATQQGDAEPGGRDYDYVTFTVADGQTLDQLLLTGFETDAAGNAGFLALIEGATMPAPPQGTAEYEALAAQLLGGVLIEGSGGLSVGSDLLGESGLGSGEVQGQTTLDFDAPLPSGTYTLWFSQGGASSTTTLTFKTSAVATATTLSVADAAPVQEAGDDGTTTTLTFPLTASGDFSGDIEVGFTVDGVAGSATVAFTDGVGALAVAVANDDADTGPTTVDLVLTSAQSGGEAVAIGTAQASGTVTEDDAEAGGGDKGALVFAVNVGGPQAIGEDGTVYQADTASSWTGSKPYADGAGTDFDGDGDVDGDDALYATDRYGGKGAAVMTFTKAGLARASTS